MQRTLTETFNSTPEYPDDFEFTTCPIYMNPQPFDRVAILYKDQVEFLKEEGLWKEDDPNSWGECQEAILLPDQDSEERAFDVFDCVICIKTLCPKEGVFFDYSEFWRIATDSNLYKIVKL